MGMLLQNGSQYWSELQTPVVYRAALFVWEGSSSIIIQYEIQIHDGLFRTYEELL
jgi:hypothetical protein